MIDYIVGVDRKILESILERSLTKWVNPVNVNRALGLDETEFGDRLTRLERWGLINTQSGTYEEGHSLRNGMNQIRLTERGWDVLKEKIGHMPS
jgi:RIO-like serine/threonine protein kinase